MINNEGLEAYGELFKIAITNHAYQRMNEEIDRFCDWVDVESLLLEKSTEIINAPQKEEFILLRNDLKLAVVCIIKNIEGFSTIVLKTVIRKVFFDNNGNEKEKIVFVDKNKNKLKVKKTLNQRVFFTFNLYNILVKINDCFLLVFYNVYSSFYNYF